MATIKRAFIFVCCLSSALAAIFTLVALVTEQWVVTDNALWLTQAELTKPNTIQYGLFQGFYSQQEPSPVSIQLIMTCLLDKNVCALLCGKNDDERYDLLRALYDNDATAEQNDENCPTIQRALSFNTNTGVVRSTADTNDDKLFINAGVWVSTIFFLSASIAFGIAASALSIWNIVSNPVQFYFSIVGLYITNAVALAFSVIAMCLWGVMHINITFHDVGIFYTLTGQMTSDKTAGLGFSFWILIIPIVCYCASVILLYVRHYLLSRDPGHKMVQREDTADPGIYLY